MKDEKGRTWQTNTYRIHPKRWWHECWVTTGRRGHIRHSYLRRPWHRYWWRTWSWGWGCCCPRCGSWRASPRSGVPGSPRCSGTSSGTASEAHRCRGGTAGWRTACRHILCPGSSLWSCDLEGTCAERRDSSVKQRQETLGKQSDKRSTEFYRAMTPKLSV